MLAGYYSMENQRKGDSLFKSLTFYITSTLSSNILYISQHGGAELFDGPPVAGRAREAYS